MIDILHGFGNPQEMRMPHEIRADGNRFDIRLVHSINQGEQGEDDCLYPTRFGVSELVNMFRILQLEINAKEGLRYRAIDALELLPSDWTPLLVALLPEANRKLKDKGVWVSADTRSDVGRVLPIGQFPDTHILGLPVYKLGQEGSAIDEVAEQIIYSIGLVRASSDGLGEPQQVHRSAHQFLQQTLGRVHLINN